MRTNRLTLHSCSILAPLLAVFLLIAFQGCSSERPTSMNEAEPASAVCLTDIQTHAESSARLSPSDMVPHITIEELKRKINSNSPIAIVDNRSQAEYDLDHIKGAICIPLTSMVAGEWTLPIDMELVFYCA